MSRTCLLAPAKLGAVRELGGTFLPPTAALVARVTVTEGGKLFSTGPLCSRW